MVPMDRYDFKCLIVCSMSIGIIKPPRSSNSLVMPGHTSYYPARKGVSKGTTSAYPLSANKTTS